jgi:hypothetical protein
MKSSIMRTYFNGTLEKTAGNMLLECCKVKD